MGHMPDRLNPPLLAFRVNSLVIHDVWDALPDVNYVLAYEYSAGFGLAEDLKSVRVDFHTRSWLGDQDNRIAVGEIKTSATYKIDLRDAIDDANKKVRLARSVLLEMLEITIHTTRGELAVRAARTPMGRKLIPVFDVSSVDLPNELVFD